MVWTRWRLLSLASIAVAACGRTGLSISSDDDAVNARGGTTNTGGTGGRSSAGATGSGAVNGNGGASGTGGIPATGGATGRGGTSGVGGFVGVGGTPVSGGGGGAGTGLTSSSGSGGSAGLAGSANGVAGQGGEAGAPDVTCVVHVASTGNDANDGSTWGQAVASLTRALDLAPPGCDVWIAGSGTYLPTTGTDRGSTFHLQATKLRGGFTGTEHLASERTFSAPLPTLSGNIGDPLDATDDAYHVVTADGDVTLDYIAVSYGRADASPGDAGAAIRASSALTLTSCLVSDSYSLGNGAGILAHGALSIKGSTLTLNTAQGYGGAIFCDSQGPVVIDDTLFEDNAAYGGGGIYVETNQAGVAVTITSGTFIYNTADIAGAAILTHATVTLEIDDSSFDTNQANSGAVIASDGPLTLASSTLQNNVAGVSVVYAEDTTTVTLADFSHNQGKALLVEPFSDVCTLTVDRSNFTLNQGDDGGAIAAYSCPVEISNSGFDRDSASVFGGAIFCDAGSPLGVATSNFQDNTATAFGGAIYAMGGVALTSSAFTRNEAVQGGALVLVGTPSANVTNCTFMDNDAAQVGGAIYADSGAVHLISALIARNTAGDASAVIRTLGDLRLTNVTIADNTSGTLPALDVGGAILVENSILWHDTPSEFVLAAASLSSEDAGTQNLFSSNLSGTYPNLSAFDPIFVDATDELYQLGAGSPCIDAADDSRAPVTDIAGHYRVQEHSTSACPTCSVADIGAYERLE